MAKSPGSIDLVRALGFVEIRSFLRRSRARGLAGFLAVAYTLGSLLLGGMLVLLPNHVNGTTLELVVGGSPWWVYPGLLVVAPWGVLALPWFAALAMVLVAIGVGLGMAVAAVLVYRLLRPTKDEIARTKAVGIATGLTPAMISLVTIGSCCTTTAAATGGIGLLAQASGTTTANLLVNSWYLAVAQVAIVWAALFGQELLLTVYGGLLGLRSGSGPARPISTPAIDRRWAAGAALRVALAVGGLLWSLSMLAEWTTHPPGSSGAGWWVRWVIEHQVVAALAVGASFFPTETARLFRALRGGPGRAVGAFFGISAATVLVWLPAPLPAWGLDSLTDQVLGALGAPAAWGAIAPGAVTGVALAFRWAVEIAVPAGFVLAAVLAPDRAFIPLLATTSRPVPTGPVEVSAFPASRRWSGPPTAAASPAAPSSSETP